MDINDCNEEEQCTKLYFTSQDILTLKTKFNKLVDDAIGPPSLEHFCQIFEEFTSILILDFKEVYNDLKINGFSWMIFLDLIIDSMDMAIECKSKLNNERLDPKYIARLLTYNQRASLIQIIGIHEPHFKYITISKLGIVGILDNKMILKNKYKVDLAQSCHSHKKDMGRVSGHVWVTEACHMSDCKKLVIASNNRTLRFYDISASTHWEEFMMYGIPSNVTCLKPHYNRDEPQTFKGNSVGSLLFFGDNKGFTHCLQFKQPQNSLFKRLDIEKTTQVFFMDLESHSEYVDYQLVDRIHRSAVLQIQYLSHNATLITCCEGHSEPLVIRNMNGYIKTYVFRHQKGVQCFDYHCKLNMLVTGGRNGLLNIWNPYVTIQPTAILASDQSTVLDVRIEGSRSIIMSYSRNMVLKLWDLIHHNCLQTINLTFPNDHGHLFMEPEHPNLPLHLETYQQKTIMIKCRDYAFEIQISTEQNENQQVLESSKETSTRLLQINEPSDEEFITEKYKDSNLSDLLDDDIALPTIATIVSSNPHLLDSEDLPKFTNQFFSDVKNGDVRRKEMQNAVLRGLPFSTLKLVDIEPINDVINLPPLFDNVQTKNSFNSKDLLYINRNSKQGSFSNSHHSRRPSFNTDGSSSLHLPFVDLKK